MVCPITNLEADRIDSTSYRIIVNDESYVIKHGIRFDILVEDEKFKKNKHLIAGAILNKQLSAANYDEEYCFTLILDDLEEKLKKIIYPKTPKEKIDNLLKTLYQLQNFDGEIVDISKVVKKPEFYYKHFFKSADECIYYLKELDYQGLIECHFLNDTEYPIDFQITFKGLNYYLNLMEQGNLSNKCFVAMSFDPQMKETRDAIKDAILKNDFEPVIIDEQLIESSQTINDAIIFAIKSCKFCIADFSQQKDGVYFESGFAVGLGKPVIYTCHKDWFSKSHFDTNHFPHIIYETNKELTEKLDIKIKAWIK
ncbi:nucleotide-binding protein [Candidatus Sulfidibacterium hydrothermale]|uniref:nucleotide-binding protein n=1 Tax=Candidatus Sulfidibacterium hydrothermale TaxID=2875962 RepID=UPI001F0A16B8|nr:nucleotide-binding protein [Candidatus Sulfidibacterium hydrothermale]UBM61360.1 nucleotide-binding protein [Candidatus Sulfidibacterium hydrothermale]